LLETPIFELTAAKNIKNKVLFSVLSLEGKNQRNFEKDNDSEKAKVPKSKKYRNEQVHFCIFCFSGQGTVGAAG